VETLRLAFHPQVEILVRLLALLIGEEVLDILRLRDLLVVVVVLSLCDVLAEPPGTSRCSVVFGRYWPEVWPEVLARSNIVAGNRSATAFRCATNGRFTDALLSRRVRR
jgi:hypothetical protein